MRSLLQTMINALLSADADAEWGRPSRDRVTQRKVVSTGHRTTVSTVAP